MKTLAQRVAADISLRALESIVVDKRICSAEEIGLRDISDPV
jgi:hypothetical protein